MLARVRLGDEGDVLEQRRAGGGAQALVAEDALAEGLVAVAAEPRASLESL
nr:hypothetical protein GCM10025732_35920 [Glycomyces mayteni]